MQDLDWGQEAGLSKTVTFDEMGDWPFSIGVDVAQGSLLEMLNLFLDLPVEERQSMSITVEGGFHLDGAEIEALAQRRARERPNRGR